MKPLFENWNKRVRIEPAAIATPRDESELVAHVAHARARGLGIKAVGSGHSFNAIMATTGTIVNMRRFDRILAVDPHSRQVRVQAGIKLRDLVVELQRHGLALPNIGAWMEQTISGVLATATHGTGGRWKLLLTDALVSYRIVDGRGQAREVSGAELRWLPLGYFGIVTEVTLQCVPLFYVRHRRSVGDLARAIDALDGALAEHDFVDLRFTGTVARGNLSTWDVTHDPPTRRDRRRFAWEGARHYAINRAVEAFGKIGAPPAISRPAYHRLGEIYMREGEAAPKTSVWWQGLTFNSRGFAPAHDELEFGMPHEATREFLHEVAAFMRRDPSSASIEVQIRFSEPADIVLAPNRDRKTMWFNLNVFDLASAHALVREVVEIVRAYDGRPHWCKCVPLRMVGLPVADIDAWEHVRRAYDPQGLFLNTYYEHTLRPSIDRVAARRREDTPITASAA